MKDFFKFRPVRDSSVSLSARSWPQYAAKERLLEEGFIPAKIWKHGYDRQVILKKSDLLPVAFDDGPNAHVSHLFKGRLFKIAVDDEYLEECVVSDYKAHPVNKEIFFVNFARQPAGILSTIPVPITLTGLFGCPGVTAGGTVDLAMPTVDLEISGLNIPPPIMVDCSSLRLEVPYSKVTLADIKNLLPKGVRLSRKYQRPLSNHDVVMCYDHRAIEEKPLPLDYQDPNFIRPSGKKYHLTYSGFWPKQ